MRNYFTSADFYDSYFFEQFGFLIYSRLNLLLAGSFSILILVDIFWFLYIYKYIKFAQQGSPISDIIEGLSYKAKSIENDECYQISKNKEKISKLEIWVKKCRFLSCIINFSS